MPGRRCRPPRLAGIATSSARPHHPPRGWTVALDRRVLRLDGGRTLVGGSPPRVLHLSPTARARLAAGALTVDDTTSATLARLLTDAGVAHPDPTHRDAPTAREVSVVVPVRDRPGELTRLLDALAATVPDLGEVVVVDDGSADPAATRTVAAAHGAHLVTHPTSRGPAAARNTGAAAATGAVLAFLDSDVVPAPGWLAPLLGHLADPAVGLAAPRIVALEGVSGVALLSSSVRNTTHSIARRAIARYETRRSSLDLGARPAPVTARSRVAYVPSAAMVVRRAAFPGFAEDMPVAEDVDLVWRLVEAGWRLRYEPAAQVAHEHRDAVVQWLARKAFYGTGAAPLALRHPRRVPPVALAPWTAAAITLLGLQRRWSVAAAGAVTVFATARLAHGLARPSRTSAPPARTTRGSAGQARPDHAGAGPASPDHAGGAPARPDRVSGATDTRRQQRHSADTTRRPTRRRRRALGLAMVLAPWGLGGAAWQAAGALTRHWWPVAVLGAVVSRRVRRALVVAAVAEGVVDWVRFREVGSVDVLTHVLAHRADDLAYGAGLWWGAWRHRTVAPLRPDLSGKGPDR